MKQRVIHKFRNNSGMMSEPLTFGNRHLKMVLLSVGCWFGAPQGRDPTAANSHVKSQMTPGAPDDVCIIKMNTGWEGDSAPAVQKYDAQRVKSLSLSSRRAQGWGQPVWSAAVG